MHSSQTGLVRRGLGWASVGPRLPTEHLSKSWPQPPAGRLINKYEFLLERLGEGQEKYWFLSLLQKWASTKHQKTHEEISPRKYRYTFDVKAVKDEREIAYEINMFLPKEKFYVMYKKVQFKVIPIYSNQHIIGYTFSFSKNIINGIPSPSPLCPPPCFAPF